MCRICGDGLNGLVVDLAMLRIWIPEALPRRLQGTTTQLDAPHTLTYTSSAGHE